MKLYVLAKNHRDASGYCAARKKSKARTAKLVIKDEAGKVVEVEVCSGCSGALHEAAVQGRKVRP